MKMKTEIYGKTATRVRSLWTILQATGMYFVVIPDPNMVRKILMVMLSVIKVYSLFLIYKTNIFIKLLKNLMPNELLLIMNFHIWLRSDRDMQTNTRLPDAVFRPSYYIDMERQKENINMVST